MIGSESVEIQIEPADDQKTTALKIRQSVVAAVSADESLQALLERSMVAVDGLYLMNMNEEVPITDNSEIAIIPPVSGG